MKISCPKCGGQMNMPEGFAAGKYNCPYCKIPFMCDEQGVTYMHVETADKSVGVFGKTNLRLPQKQQKHKMTYAEMKRKVLQDHVSEISYKAPKEPGDDNKVLCILMGALFWIIGLVIAAIVDKGRGLKRALIGMGISVLITLIIVMAK